MSEVSLVVDGKDYSGWNQVSLRFSVEELCPSFSVGYTERLDDASEPIEIVEGDEVEVFVDGELVLTGYVDDVSEDYDSAAPSHTLSIAGRAKTGDLIDCSYPGKGVIRKKKFRQIAATLCEPFGIGVSFDTLTMGEAEALDELLTKPIPKFVVEYGETPFEALTRLARSRGLFLATSAGGDLVFARSQTLPLNAIIRQGENVKRGGYHGSFRDRYSDYVWRSQTAGDDNWNGKNAAHIKHEITDGAITRTRVLALRPEHGIPKDELERRATWERNTRAAKSQRLSYTVNGWSHLSGLWQPNTLPMVIDDVLGVSNTYLISTVELTIDASGEIANLELVGPGAYDVLEAPLVKRKKKRKRA